MRYYIIAGEASGDLHGGRLVKAIRAMDAAATIQAWGGEQMQQAGANLVKHYSELAFMGFAEVVKNLPAIFRNIQFCKKDILAFNPDVVVLIDYPGFNLRIAPWAKKNGYKVAYYISPQVWAWKEGRVKKMKTCIDHLMAILPFEKEYFFNRWNWKIEYVGHPLLEAIDQTQLHPPTPIPTTRPIVALLPGSRKQEIRKKLPLMLAVSAHFTNYQFVVAKAPGLHEEFYSTWQEQYPNVLFVTGKTYDLLRQSQAALVTSGTATLETALLQIPQVVCYKGSSLSYEIGKRLIKINYISLVNLILNQPLVEELIQYKLTTPALIASLEKILTPSVARQTILEGYTRLRGLLQQEEPASKKAATSIIALAKKLA